MSSIVPLPAVLLLISVSSFLALLVLLLIYLNKLFCFKNCSVGSIFMNVYGDSDSEDGEDSDEDAAINFEFATKSNDSALSALRQRSLRKKEPVESGDQLTSVSEPTEIQSFTEKSCPIGCLKLTFALSSKQKQLSVTIKQFLQTDLCAENQSSNNFDFSSSFTEVHGALLTQRKNRCKTRMMQGLDPKFEEKFAFSKITEETLKSVDFRFRVYQGSRSNNIKLCGQCEASLQTMLFSEDNDVSLAVYPEEDVDGSSSASVKDEIVRCLPIFESRCPRLFLALMYSSVTGRLTVKIIKAMNVSLADGSVLTGCYVKVFLFSASGDQLSYGKTALRCDLPNPIFTEIFSFQVPLFQLVDVTLMFSLNGRDKNMKKHNVGWIAMGSKASGKDEQAHWISMKSSSFPILKWHTLLETTNTVK